MPTLSPTEQMWRDDVLSEGLRLGIHQLLKLRFGQPGLDLMPRVRLLIELPDVQSFFDAIEFAPDLDALRELLPKQS